MQRSDDIIKMIRLIKALKADEEKPDAPMGESKEVRSLKAAVPYLPLDEQKTLSVIIKIMEIKNMLLQYQNMAEKNKVYPADFRKGIIMAFREQATDEQKKMIDMFMKISKVMAAINADNAYKENHAQ